MYTFDVYNIYTLFPTFLDVSRIGVLWASCWRELDVNCNTFLVLYFWFRWIIEVVCSVVFGLVFVWLKNNMILVKAYFITFMVIMVTLCSNVWSMEVLMGGRKCSPLTSPLRVAMFITKCKWNEQGCPLVNEINETRTCFN